MRKGTQSLLADQREARDFMGKTLIFLIAKRGYPSPPFWFTRRKKYATNVGNFITTRKFYNSRFGLYKPNLEL